MADFTVHTLDTAPEQSRDILARAALQFGFIPNLYAVMAEAPVLLKSYRRLSELLEGGRLSAAERQIVYLAVSQANLCHYCLAAHGALAAATGLSEPVVAAVREGRRVDTPKFEALRRVTAALVEKRGWLSEDDLSSFFGAGYGRDHLLEVIAGVGLKTMSNYTNHLAHTPVDEAFRKFELAEGPRAR